MQINLFMQIKHRLNMKKNIFFMLIAVMFLLMGCFDNIDIMPDKEKLTDIGISFKIAGNDTATKALDVTTANITSFEATSYPASTTETPCFSALTFTGVSSGTYTTSSPAIWRNNTSLDFYAWSAGSSSGQVAKTAYNTFTVAPAATAASQADLVFACTKDKTISVCPDGVVPLNFWHAESKVNVKVINTSSAYRFQILGWKLGYLDGSATFIHDGTATDGTGSFPMTCWIDNSSPSASISYTSDFSSSPVAVATEVSSPETLPGEMIVIPQSVTSAYSYVASVANAPVNGSYVGLRIKIINNSSGNVVFGESDGEWAIWPTDFSWNPGQQYSYTINIGKSGYQERNPSNETKELASMFPVPPKIYSFGGIMIAPAPLYYNGSTFVIKDNDWNHESWQSVSGKTSGSYYFDFKDIGPFFSSTGSWTSTSNSNIDNLGNKVSYGDYNDWRVPTPAEWQTIIGTSRAGSTVNGNTSKHYSFIRLTGVTHAGNSSPYGVLLFPDNETITGVTLNGFDNTTITSNITNDQLNDYLNQGCAFLPASGWRYRSSGSWERGGQNTYYWSTAKNGNTTAQALRITTSGGTSLTFSTSVNCGTNGYYVPVRLVRTAE